jgi:hypothetical protein
MCDIELNKMDIHLMEEITKNLNDNDFESDFQFETIFVNYGMDAHINIYENDVLISFNTNSNNYNTAMIMKLVMEVTTKYKLYNIEIDEPYLEIFDDNFNYVDVLYGFEEIEEYKSNISEIISYN